MVTIAGWLYADLLLAIAMVFFVFNTVGQQSTPTPTRSPTMSPTQTSTATPTLTPTSTRSSRPPTSTATVTTSVTPRPTSTPTPRGGLIPIAAEISFHVDAERLLGNQGAAARSQEQVKVRQIIRDRLAGLAPRRAGIVLTFGTSRRLDPTRGNELAKEVNALLASELPLMFGNTVFKPYHNLDDTAVGDIDLEIYWILD